VKTGSGNITRSILYFVQTNRIIIIIGLIAISSWVIPKNLLSLSLPNYKDNNVFEMVEESKRLKTNEINIATNYGFRAAEVLMDKGDHKFKPEVVMDNLGNKKYRYIFMKFESTKLPDKVEERAIDLKNKFVTSREMIKFLLKNLREIGVTVAIGNPGKAGAAAVWSPQLQTIRISEGKMEQGSLAVLRVLNHEAIHVAQSCKSGGINYRVLPMGVDLSPEKIYNNQISSNIYSRASSDIRTAEKEAYSYEYSSRSAIYFINKYCKKR
jgi:hypothetical protein